MMQVHESHIEAQGWCACVLRSCCPPWGMEPTCTVFEGKDPWHLHHWLTALLTCRARRCLKLRST
eukprot:812665-Pelagomonas_calceolata.AAC.9